MALKILSIDDEPSITTLLSLLLGTYGMEVITANSGKDGLQLVRTEAPDLVLLDIMMPEMSGVEVCQAIRSFSDVPVLAFSVMSDSQEITKAMEAGFNDFLEKPSSSEILVTRIQEFTVGRA